MVESKIQVLKKHCRRVGRNFSEVTLGVSMTPSIKEGRFSMDTESIEACLRLGVKIFTLRFSALRGKTQDVQAKFAKEIMPSFKSSR